MKQAFEEKTDKMNYLKGLIRLSKCDGKIDPAEKEYFNYVAENMQLSSQDIQDLDAIWDSKENIALVFSTKYNSVFFLQEAVQICAVDGVYDENERKEMRKVAAELEVAEADLEKIEEWVMQGIEWRHHGEALIDDICKRSEAL